MQFESNDLPSPSAEARAHSERLRACIVAEIQAQGGRIPFARFMELALYAPGLGYYSAGARKFGAAGDFVTAPELSPLFARCLARQCEPVLHALGNGDILEIGAGTGAMAAEVLAELARRAALPARYFILELSADLRARQAESLRERVPELAARVSWLDAWPRALRGVVLANEVMDAMPAHRYTVTEQGLAELYVAWNEEAGDGAVSGFLWQTGEPSSEILAARLTALQQELGEGYFAPGYTSEINLAAEGWLGEIGARLEAGAVLLIDYGFPRREYYHPQRDGGTLMCHYRHRAHDDPLILVGLQDITAHVDFTAVAEAGVAAGLSLAGYTTQGMFLLGLGITDMAMSDDAMQQLRYAQQIKKLTLPHEMGELFKVMAFTRELDLPLAGFALRDLRGRL